MRKNPIVATLPCLAWALAPAAAQEIELPTITVESAAAASGAGVADGLVPLTTSAATKTDTPIERIPQSVSVVTQEELRQRQPQSVEQAIAYVPGVVPSPWGQDDRFRNSATLEFYKRNYVEGLFLSSGVTKSPDHTMEELVRVARTLRRDHGFAGYIHLKTIPEANPWLVEEAGRWADRLSINLELPTDAGLAKLAPEKRAPSIRAAMKQTRERILEARADKRRFAPAGQSTQLIIGADAATDADVLATSSTLYSGFGLKRVYYSAFSPIPEPSPALPLKPPPLQRENRLYQADWLIRFYGFDPAEIAEETGMLDLDADPKLAWALRHRDRFPVDVNRAPRELLLRVPGLGVKAVDRLIRARRHRTLRFDDLARLSASPRRAAPFVVTADHRAQGLDRVDLRNRLVRPPEQLSLFA